MLINPHLNNVRAVETVNAIHAVYTPLLREDEPIGYP